MERPVIDRLPDWEPRLLDAIAAAEPRPHAYGRWDCALWAAACVEAQTGHDFGAPFRGRYSSARGSVRALRKFGAGTLADTVTAALGPPVAPLLAQRGDIVFDGQSTGVLWVGHALFVGDAGLIDVGLSAIVHAWRVQP